MPSTVIDHYRYDPVTKRLRIFFVSGMIYDYKAITKDTYEKFRTAFSKGKFLNEEIKGRYAFEKIDE
jgi:hypothetical protein